MDYANRLDTEWLIIAGILASWVVQLVFSMIILARSGNRTMRALEDFQETWQKSCRQREQKLEKLELAQNQGVLETQRNLRQFALHQLSGPAQPPARRFGVDAKHQVVGLAQKGLTPSEISQRLRMHKGETELVLGLSEYAVGKGDGDDEEVTG